MKKVPFVPVFVLIVAAFFGSIAGADDTLVKFKGGIGVIPVANVSGAANPTGSFPDVTRNIVLGVNPGGFPWVINDLNVVVKMNGDVFVDGRGLLLAGGNNIGTNGGQSVRARLFCGGIAHDSDLVPLAPNGDFKIKDVLAPLPTNSCTNPVLLIVSGGGNWFAAGIRKTDKGDD